MKPTLQPGLSHTFRYTVPESKTVPQIYPEAADFQVMPRVLATGYMVALCEWACIDLIKPHLDWPAEQSLGTHVDLTHTAATPPGMTVAVEATLTRVDGRLLEFSIRAHDGVDEISRGRHQRVVIDPQRFQEKIARKLSAAGLETPA
ncbi:MAG TPA: thioesterase family protein [Usitatibacteraceae bacterium]|nr:thioesterase family protein [Usitatibacteraceae bacterium]